MDWIASVLAVVVVAQSLLVERYRARAARCRREVEDARLELETLERRYRRLVEALERKVTARSWPAE